jgi:spore germination protein
MKILNKKVTICVVSMEFFLVFLLTGCWSSKNIEELNIIIGTSVDREEDGKISSTLQYVVPQALAAGKNGAVAQKKPYTNISDKGVSLEPIGWETTLKKEGVIFGAHQKIVILGEKLAREVNLEEIMDLFYRDIDIRGSVLVFIAKGKANKTLELKDTTIIPALHIAEIANQQQTTRILKPLTLTRVFGIMEAGSSFLLQRLVATNGEVKFDGAAIIKGKTNTMIGVFNKKELEAINWLTGESIGGTVKAYNQETDHPVFYQVISMKSRIEPKVKGDKISFHVNIESEGRIAEYWNKYAKPAFEKKSVIRIEKEAEKEVERLVKNVVIKMQEEYQVDVAGFGNQLRIKYPRVWEKVKGDWDQKFSEIPIDYTVQLTIKDYGKIGEKRIKES